MQRFAVLGLALHLLAFPAAGQEDGVAHSEAAGARKFRKAQKRPISLATSGGNAMNIVDGICYSGTLGFLVEKLSASTAHYIVSNAHVLTLDNEAEKGDPISQPGLIDLRPACTVDEDDVVARLSAWKRVKLGGKGNKVDVGIAEVIPGAVKTSGRLLALGVPGNTTVSPRVGQQVTKAGRSTGVTRGVVGAVNVTALVQFTATEEARFKKQFTIETAGFVDSGDSGSGVFVDGSPCPPLVGLVMAGNEQGWGLANRAADVLKAIGKMSPRGAARVVGCSPPSELSVDATPLWYQDSTEWRKAVRTQRRLEKDLLELPAVVGVGLGRDAEDSSEIVFKVFLAWSDEKVRSRIPDRIGRFRTELVESGPWTAH